jgi:GntR family histidine utilization transcriptional repressor
MSQFSQIKQPFEQPEIPNVPHYERINKRIVEHIGSNGLKAGDRLPTEAKLCTQFGLSRQTIGRALNELTTEGVLARIRGSGTYVAEKTKVSPKCRP